MTELVTGVPQTLLIDLKTSEGAVVDLTASSAAVSARVTIITLDRSQILVAEQTVTSATVGAIWASGRVAVPLTAPQTLALDGQATVQAEVKTMHADGSIRLWPRLSQVIVVTRGTIP